MKKSIFLSLALWLTVAFSVSGQYTTQSIKAKKSKGKVYNTGWADGVITAAGIGTTIWGTKILGEKEGLSDEYLEWVLENQDAARAHIPKFDRWSAGNYNDDIAKLTDIPFYASFTFPLFFLGHEKTRKDFGQIGLLYVETMSITGSLFTQVAGRTERNRPLVYATTDNEHKHNRKAENSFFAGHTAATATATFFAAKVFNDYFPNSRAKPFVWAGAMIIPAVVAYGRLEAGKHFLSDNLLGYGIGATVGILVPHLHKVGKERNYSLVPISGPYDGLAFSYQF